MTKQEFTAALRSRLSGLPREDMERSIEFYCEMIDDRMEDGLTEEDAVSQVGSVEEVAAQITSDIPLSRLVKEKVRPKRNLQAWEIVLLVLGSPIWLSLLVAAFVVVLSAYVVIWSVVISLWSVAVAVAACVVGGAFSAAVLAIQGDIWIGVAMLGAALVCAGISILLFAACKEVSRAMLLLTKKILLGIKSCFIGKGEVK